MPLQDSPLLSPISSFHKDAAAKYVASSFEKQQPRCSPLTSLVSISSLLCLARDPVGRVSHIVAKIRDGPGREKGVQWQQLEQKKKILYLRLKNATSFDEYYHAAKQLDTIEGNDAWKNVFDSTEYDPYLVEARLKQLEDARISCDVGRMLFLVRTALSRNLGNMDNIKLYKHSHIGTKDLIDRYIITALATLDQLLDVSGKSKCDRMETKYILEQVLSARQAFGRSALLLSGGATFGMNHVGVLKTLWEAHLLPRIISGSSAGSIISAVFCTRTDEEIPEILESFAYGDLAVFEDDEDKDGIIRRVARFLKYGALFDISHLTRVMKDLLGDMTFQEAYNRTRRILNICVSSAGIYELPRLLNYVSAPNVIIWSAVAASCAVPLIFSSSSLLAKDPRTGEAITWNPSHQRWVDGSVDNDLPMTRLAEMFNVNHFIVSQVNPHVIPFIAKEEEMITDEVAGPDTSTKSSKSFIRTMTDLAKSEALHRMHFMAELGVFPNMLTKAMSVLSQKYSGDITILPEISYAHFPYMLMNPTTEFVQEATLCGEKATWPKLSRIRNHCAIELALDDAVQKLRARVVFTPSQVDLRLSSFVRSKADSSHRLARGRDHHRERTKRTTRSSEPSDGLSIFFGSNRRSRHSKSRSSASTVAVPVKNILEKSLDLSFKPHLSEEHEPINTEIITKVQDHPLPSPFTSSTPSEDEEGLDDMDDEELSNAPSISSSSTTSSRTRMAPELFASKSQPVTPLAKAHHRNTFFSTTPPPTAFPPLAAGATGILQPKSPMLWMTPSAPTAAPSAAPSSPEMKYRNWLRQQSNSNKTDPSQQEQGEDSEETNNNNCNNNNEAEAEASTEVQGNNQKRPTLGSRRQPSGLGLGLGLTAPTAATTTSIGMGMSMSMSMGMGNIKDMSGTRGMLVRKKSSGTLKRLA